MNPFLSNVARATLNRKKTSLECEEIKKRSAAEWDTMELEIGDLPDFEESYQRVANFYEQLPWETN